MKKYFRVPTNVDEKIMTSAQCHKTITGNTAMDNFVSQELGERVKYHLRYKLVELRVQKMLQTLAGSTASSKTIFVNKVRNCGWTDHVRIIDSTLALWKSAPIPENGRSTRHTPFEYKTSHSHCRGYNMFFCNFKSAVVNTQKVTEFKTSQH